MAVRHGYGKIAGADALVFAYDTGDTRNSYRGEPTVNYVPGSFPYGLYAYASGPVDTTVLNEENKSITAKRYTITSAVNTARAAIYPSGLTTGVAYTFSFKWKYNGTTTTSPGIGVDASKGYPEGGANNNGFTSTTASTVSIGNGWYLTTYTFVFSSNPTGASMLTFGIITGSNASYLGETFDVYEAQFEIKGHKTQYANGIRSITEGLKDLTGNSDISLNSSTFDSNAQIDLDGTNTSIYPGTISAASALSEVTFETIVKSDANNKNILLTAGNAILVHYGGAGFYLVSSDGIASGYLGWNNEITGGTGVYEHLVATWDGTTMKLYVNGQKTTYDKSFTGGGTGVLKAFNNATLGGYFNSTQPNFNGKIDVAKIYSRALTAAEVKNNYNNYKGRFNL